MMKEAYGFVGIFSSTIGYIIFLVWAFLPSDTLESMGIEYYPTKYWALAIPCYLCVFVLVSIMVYMGSNLMLVLDNNSTYTFSDSDPKYIVAQIEAMKVDSFCLKSPISSTGVIPGIRDIDIINVNKILYGDDTFRV